MLLSAVLAQRVKHIFPDQPGNPLTVRRWRQWRIRLDSNIFRVPASLPVDQPYGQIELFVQLGQFVLTSWPPFVGVSPNTHQLHGNPHHDRGRLFRSRADTQERASVRQWHIRRRFHWWQRHRQRLVRGKPVKGKSGAVVWHSGHIRSAKRRKMLKARGGESFPKLGAGKQWHIRLYVVVHRRLKLQCRKTLCQFIGHALGLFSAGLVIQPQGAGFDVEVAEATRPGQHGRSARFARRGHDAAGVDQRQQCRCFSRAAFGATGDMELHDGVSLGDGKGLIRCLMRFLSSLGHALVDRWRREWHRSSLSS